MTDAEKRAAYDEVGKQIAGVLEGERNAVARMATIACLLAQAFPHFYWTGFYAVDPERPDELVIGPYQGTLGCLRIPFGRGACGVAAARGETQIIPDVHAFEGHIACDSRSNSEIVLPVRDAAARLIAVLDIDSVEFGSFDATDGACLAAILDRTFAA